MVFIVYLFSSSSDLEVQRYKIKMNRRGRISELDKYLIRLVLCFFQGKNIDSNVSQKQKKYLEGNERGFKERKIERQREGGQRKRCLNMDSLLISQP